MFVTEQQKLMQTGTREGLARRGEIYGDLEVLYGLAILRSGEEMDWRWTCVSQNHTWDFHMSPRTVTTERQGKGFQRGPWCSRKIF